LIDDGQLALRVVDKTPDRLKCRVLVGGPLSSRKGMNLPDTDLSVPAITEKDWQCVDWAIEHELDYLSLSFVQRGKEIQELTEYVQKKLPRSKNRWLSRTSSRFCMPQTALWWPAVIWV
jgi:pyruvate kinase